MDELTIFKVNPDVLAINSSFEKDQIASAQIAAGDPLAALGLFDAAAWQTAAKHFFIGEGGETRAIDTAR